MVNPGQAESSTEARSWVPARGSSLTRMWARLFGNKLAVVGAGIVLLMLGLVVLAPHIDRYPYQETNLFAAYQGPSWQHWFGTDNLGRDQFVRIFYGLGNAFKVGFGAEVVELTVGVLVGALAGYKGGWIDNLLMRTVDIVYAFPSLLFSIILVVILGRSILVILIAIAATSWVGMARVVRSQVLTIRQSRYIMAARSMGASSGRALWRYVLPNAMGPIVVAVSFGIPGNMMVEAGMSLIGLGIEPPTPDLGALISLGQASVFSYPYLLIFPTGVFMLTLIGFTFFGNGMRDAFDTRHKR